MRATHVAIVQKTEAIVDKMTDFVYSERMNLASAICASRTKTVTTLGGTFGKNVTTVTPGNMAECIEAAQKIGERDLEVAQKATDKALEQYAHALATQSRVSQLEAEREAQSGEAKKRAAQETKVIVDLSNARAAAENERLRLQGEVNKKEAALNAARKQTNANANKIKTLANAQASAKESAAAAANRIKELEAALEESKKRKRQWTKLFTKSTNVVGATANFVGSVPQAGTAVVGAVKTGANFAGYAVGLGTFGLVAVSLYVFYVFAMGWAKSLQMPSFSFFGTSNRRVQQLKKNHAVVLEKLKNNHTAAMATVNQTLENERRRLEAEVASAKRETEALTRQLNNARRNLAAALTTVGNSNSGHTQVVSRRNRNNNNNVSSGHTQVVAHGNSM